MSNPCWYVNIIFSSLQSPPWHRYTPVLLLILGLSHPKSLLLPWNGPCSSSANKHPCRSAVGSSVRQHPQPPYPQLCQDQCAFLGSITLFYPGVPAKVTRSLPPWTKISLRRKQMLSIWTLGIIQDPSGNTLLWTPKCNVDLTTATVANVCWVFSMRHSLCWLCHTVSQI